jgi:hypothetical protein
VFAIATAVNSPFACAHCVLGLFTGGNALGAQALLAHYLQGTHGAVGGAQHVSGDMLQICSGTYAGVPFARSNPIWSMRQGGDSNAHHGINPWTLLWQ